MDKKFNFESNLLINIQEMINFLFLKPNTTQNIFEEDNEENENKKQFIDNINDINDGINLFKNDEFTLYTFKNECDYTYNIQFDIIHCNSNLNIIDKHKISLFGNKLNFGTFNDNNFGIKNYWNKIKNILLGYKFVKINNWYIISIQLIDTTINQIQKNKCYYLICAEIDGTYITTIINI